MARLDEMDFSEISEKYKQMFVNLVTDLEFKEISDEIEGLYQDYIQKVVEEKYKVKGGTFGRGELKWGRNIIWGWFIEILVLFVLKKNKLIKDVNFLGGDSSHSFTVDEKNKIIEIVGIKAVTPDYLVVLKTGENFTIELKTAAVGVFSIKKKVISNNYIKRLQIMTE